MPIYESGLTWKLESEPPNPDAIARMRAHFPKPQEPMPIAWFMSGEITLIKGLDGNSDATKLCDALREIKVGITAFPDVQYVPLWKAWFRYLLPDLIVRANDPDNFNDFSKYILVITIVTFFNIYPGEIIEEYPGFREDVVSTLGTRAIPHPLARETTIDEEIDNRLFIDLWDASYQIKHYGFCSFEEVNSSSLFCLKYLTPTQISAWGLSLFQIESPQWHLQLLFWLTAWRSLLRLVETDSDEAGKLQEHIESSDILSEFWIPPFKTFDEFIAPVNVQAIEQVIAEEFTFDLFQTWKSEILNQLSISKYNLERDSYLSQSFEEIAQELETVLFPTPSS